ncbi:MAG TPA: hypothetical protein VL326_14365 [Kofleriaceae bacterium]|jgi:hypothetical protein|nr:hypothetical protein [Kofleriaceae bacterium]
MRRAILIGAICVAACGEHGATPPIDAAPLVDAPPCTNVVFLNRAGGTYTPGSDDATTNKSSVIGSAPRTIEPFPYADSVWSAIKTCVTDALTPYGATVTDVDPATAPHHEIVFTTAYWGSGPGVVTTSAARCPSGGLPAYGVAFVFSQTIGPETTYTCELALMQLGAEIAGLDQATNCSDYMGSLLPACSSRSYLDKDVTCGDSVARDCHCGGTTQNSHRAISAALCQ